MAQSVKTQRVLKVSGKYSGSSDAIWLKTKRTVENTNCEEASWKVA